MSRFNDITLFDSTKAVVVADSGVLPVYDGRKLTNVKPVTERIDFTDENSASVEWDGAKTVAVITHHMNCIPVVSVYETDGNTQLFPTMKILSSTKFSLDFDESYDEIGYAGFYCIISYGSEYGSSSSEIEGTLSSYIEEAEAAKNAAIQAAMNAMTAGNPRSRVENLIASSVEIESLSAGTDYHYGTISSFTVSSAEKSDVESTVDFNSGNTACVITLPSNINQEMLETPEANKRYKMSILDGIAVGMNFTKEA